MKAPRRGPLRARDASLAINQIFFDKIKCEYFLSYIFTLLKKIVIIVAGDERPISRLVRLKNHDTQETVMGKDYHEKDYEDEVYEDDYYEEHYDEEELTEEDLEEEVKRSKDLGGNDEDEDDEDLEEESVDDWEDDDVKRVAVSYACDECDYRWDDVVMKRKGDEIEDRDVICPMCGSMNVTLI